MAQLLLQRGMWGRQELAEGTWAEMHMGLDAGVSGGVQAAVEGSQVAVRRMPVPWALLVGLVEEVGTWHGCSTPLKHTAGRCWQA